MYPAEEEVCSRGRVGAPDGVMERAGGMLLGVNDLSPGPPNGVNAGGAPPFGVNDLCGGPRVGVCDRNCGPGNGELRPLSSAMRGKDAPIPAAGVRRPVLSIALSGLRPDHDGGLDAVMLRSSGKGRELLLSEGCHARGLFDRLLPVRGRGSI